MIKLILALVAAPLSVIAAARALSGTWEIHELPDDARCGGRRGY